MLTVVVCVCVLFHEICLSVVKKKEARRRSRKTKTEYWCVTYLYTQMNVLCIKRELDLIFDVCFVS